MTTQNTAQRLTDAIAETKKNIETLEADGSTQGLDIQRQILAQYEEQLANLSGFVVHHSQRSKWETYSTLHREGCGKVPFTRAPGKKRQGDPIPAWRALSHAASAEKNPGVYYKVCPCARKALKALAEQK